MCKTTRRDPMPTKTILRSSTLLTTRIKLAQQRRDHVGASNSERGHGMHSTSAITAHSTLRTHRMLQNRLFHGVRVKVFGAYVCVCVCVCVCRISPDDRPCSGKIFCVVSSEKNFAHSPNRLQIKYFARTICGRKQSLHLCLFACICVCVCVCVQKGEILYWS